MDPPTLWDLFATFTGGEIFARTGAICIQESLHSGAYAPFPPFRLLDVLPRLFALVAFGSFQVFDWSCGAFGCPLVFVFLEHWPVPQHLRRW